MREKRPALPLDAHGIKQAAKMVRAFNHPLRQRLLKAIHRSGSINVGDLCKEVGEIQPVVSQHLAILRRVGFVQAAAEGRSVIYSVNRQRVDGVQKVVHKLVDSPRKRR